MDKKVIGAIIVGLALVVTGLIFFASNGSEKENTSTTTVDPVADESSAENSEVPETPDSVITVAEVAMHDTKEDCWTIIDNTVYDVTDYVSRHPGGVEILRACGTDGSSLFNSRTTEEGETVGSGTSHSSNARSILSSFEVGPLEQ